MPWWERRMWIEKINAEFSPPEGSPEQQPPPGESWGEHVEVSDDITTLGITPQSLA